MAMRAGANSGLRIFSKPARSALTGGLPLCARTVFSSPAFFRTSTGQLGPQSLCCPHGALASFSHYPALLRRATAQEGALVPFFRQREACLKGRAICRSSACLWRSLKSDIAHHANAHAK